MQPQAKPPFFGDAGELVKYAQPTEWIVEGLLPKGCLVILAGAPKWAGKTWKAMDLGLAVASGKPWLLQPTLCQQVLYSFLEDGTARVARRLKALGVRSGTRTGFTVDTDPSNFGGKLEKLQHCSPLLWIVDPLIRVETSMGIENENDAIGIAGLMAQLHKLCHEYGHTILLTHHYRKDGRTMRGSSALQGEIDGWWEVYVRGSVKSGLTSIAWTLRDDEPGEIGCRMTSFEDGSMRLDWQDVEDMPGVFNPAETVPTKTKGHGNGEASGKPRRTTVGNKIVEYLASCLDQTAQLTDIAAAIDRDERTVRYWLGKQDGPCNGAVRKKYLDGKLLLTLGEKAARWTDFDPNDDLNT